LNDIRPPAIAVALWQESHTITGTSNPIVALINLVYAMPGEIIMVLLLTLLVIDIFNYDVIRREKALDRIQDRCTKKPVILSVKFLLITEFIFVQF